MDITYLGHSSFKIKTKNATVICDPFDPKMVGLKFAKVDGVDVVTVSHSHADHNYLDNVKNIKMLIDDAGEYEVSGVSIQGIRTFHDNKSGEERGENVIYVFEVEGLRLIHLGDLGHKLTQDLIEEVGTIDIMMVPVGGFYTIDSALACEVVRAIEPSIVIPMHYKVSGLSPELSDKLLPLDNFLKECGMTVENMDKLSIKKSDISETESKVVVLSA